MNPFLMALMGPDQAANLGAMQQLPAAPPQQPNGLQAMMGQLGGSTGLLGAGLGMLGASYDKNINPWQSALQGMTTMQAMKNRSDLVNMQKSALEERKAERKGAIEQQQAIAKRGQMLIDSLQKRFLANDGVIDANEQAQLDWAKYQVASGKDVSGKMFESPGAGPFEGQGMEAQAMNLYLANKDNPEWLASPEGQMVQQRLTRGIATPMGMVPGYDLNALAGGAPTVSIPKPPAEGQRKAQYAANSMITAEQSVQDILGKAGFDPTAAGNMWAKTPFVGNYLASEDYQQYQAGADEWTTNVVFLRSGATAREEEKTSAFKNYWPQPGDGKGTVLYKQMLRDQQMANAYQQGMTNPESPAFQSPTQQQDLARLQQKAAMSEALYKRYTASGGEPGNSQWTDSDEQRLRELEAKLNATQ